MSGLWLVPDGRPASVSQRRRRSKHWLGRRLPHAAMLVAFGALAAAGAPSARAATYYVVACDAAPFGHNRAWRSFVDPQWRVHAACPSSGDARRGLYAEASRNVMASTSRAGWTFRAPAGATIAGGYFSFAARSGRGGRDPYRITLSNQHGARGLLFACGGRRVCPGRAHRIVWKAAPAGSTKLRWQVACVRRRVGCTPSEDGVGSLHVYYAVVRVRDAVRPHVSADGRLWRWGWHRGAESLRFRAGDNVGLWATSVSVDDRERSRTSHAGECSFTRPAPCPRSASGSYRLDTRELADGAHWLRVDGLDAAGNRRGVRTLLAVDNTAPARVREAAIDGGSAWRSVNGFTVRWTNPPGQVSPIVRARYRLCPAGGTSPCTSKTATGRDIDTIAGIAVPRPGEYTVRVWLEDEAGNADPDHASDALRLRFDDTVPGRAEPEALEGWTNAEELSEPIRLGDGADPPPSGVAGYSVTIDGSDPDRTPETGADGVYRGPVPEGVVRLTARAVSGAGVPSDRVGSVDVHVDRTPPSATVEGAPDPDAWQRGPVRLSLSGTDQPELSGMAPAPSDEPVAAGAYMAYSLDGMDTRTVRGGTAEVVVADDGRHTLAFHAVDAAGNASGEERIAFSVDRTPPETAFFESQDPNDPRRISVAVADRLSGIAGGYIEMRRAGRGAWQRLATAYRGRHLDAYLDDDDLPDGAYEFRAFARDAAGNVREATARRDGSAMVLELPLRIPSRFVIDRLGAHAVRRPARERAAWGPARIPFGGSPTLRARLQSRDGRPIARAAVEVLERPRTAREYRSIGTAFTDRRGRLRFRLPPGPSGSVRLSYAGTKMVKPSAMRLVVLVPAHSSLRTDRRSLSNGQRVRFFGRLGGGHIPSGGKDLELQAFVRGQWRTFATALTDARGAWRYTYRFTVTTRTTRYRFRVRIRGEADYPYERGYSRIIAVTVYGD